MYESARDNLDNLSQEELKKLHSFFTSDYFAVRILRIEKDLDSLVSKLEENISREPEFENLQYVRMPRADTYAKGVEALRNACLADPLNAQPLFTQNDNSRIIRPLTFEENIKARVNDFETLLDENGNDRSLEQRKRLFNTWLDSCTGIAYKSKTTKFKIITECSELINIANNFKKAYLPISYDAVNGIELDSNNDIYNTLLTPQQVLEHKAWNAVVNDSSLLKTYSGIVFQLHSGDERMGFRVRQNTEKDELRALYVNNIDLNSIASGTNNLNNNAYFLRVTQKNFHKN